MGGAGSTQVSVAALAKRVAADQLFMYVLATLQPNSADFRQATTDSTVLSQGTNSASDLPLDHVIPRRTLFQLDNSQNQNQLPPDSPRFVASLAHFLSHVLPLCPATISRTARSDRGMFLELLVELESCQADFGLMRSTEGGERECLEVRCVKLC